MNIRWHSRIIVQCVGCDLGIYSYIEKYPYYLDLPNEIFRSENAMMSVFEITSTKHRQQIQQHATLVKSG